MEFKFEIIGNFLVVTDNLDREVVVALRRSVVPRINSKEQILYLLGVNNDEENNESPNKDRFKLDEIVNASGVPFTITALKTFLFNELGKSNATNQGGEGSENTITDIVIAPNSEVVTDIKLVDYIDAFVEFLGEGEVIASTGTIDPDNVSTNEANLINGNFTDLAYNNSQQGTDNRSLPGIDLGVAKAFNRVNVYWWRDQYTAVDYKIQGSNNGTAWVDLVVGLNSENVIANNENPQRIDVDANFRYIRVFSVDGADPNFVVLSELQVLTEGEIEVKNISDFEAVTVEVEGEFVKFVNTGTNQVLIKVLS